MPPLTRDKQFSLLGAAALWDAPVKGILEVYNRSLQENPLNVAYLCGDHRTLFFFVFFILFCFLLFTEEGKSTHWRRHISMCGNDSPVLKWPDLLRGSLQRRI